MPWGELDLRRARIDVARAGRVRPARGAGAVGEPFWRQDPEPAHLEWSGLRRDEFGTHAANVAAGASLGLVPLYALASDEVDFDRYEALQWRAADRHAREHPDDPDVPELLRRVDRGRHEYLTWGRATLGWSLYLFRRQVRAGHRGMGVETRRRDPQGRANHASRSAAFAAPGAPSKPIVHIPVPSRPSARNRRHLAARARASST